MHAFLGKKESRSMSQMPDKKYSTSSHEIPVEDLLGIADQVDLLGIQDEVDNYSTLGSSSNILKGGCGNSWVSDDRVMKT